MCVNCELWRDIRYAVRIIEYHANVSRSETDKIWQDIDPIEETRSRLKASVPNIQQAALTYFDRQVALGQFGLLAMLKPDAVVFCIYH